MAKEEFEKAAKPQVGELIKACKNIDIARVKELLEQGADINENDNSGDTALIWFSVMGNADVVQMLIEKGAALDKQTKEGNTALGMASFFGLADIAQMLIDAGAKIDEKNKDGKTALDNAREKGHDVIVAMLEQIIQAKQEKRQRILEQVADPSLRRPLAVKAPPKLGGGK